MHNVVFISSIGDAEYHSIGRVLIESIRYNSPNPNYDLVWFMDGEEVDMSDVDCITERVTAPVMPNPFNYPDTFVSGCAMKIICAEYLQQRGYKRAVSIDFDTIVNIDLNALFDLDMNDIEIAGVSGCGCAMFSHYSEKLPKIRDIGDTTSNPDMFCNKPETDEAICKRKFNGGLYVFNMDMCVFNDYVELYKSNPMRNNDEDYVERTFTKKMMLPRELNYFVLFGDQLIRQNPALYKKINHDAYSASIMHYQYVSKPFHFEGPGNLNNELHSPVKYFKYFDRVRDKMPDVFCDNVDAFKRYYNDELIMRLR
ncbi:hypothetical protein VPHK567_0306 [Vibrio phage K567]